MSKGRSFFIPKAWGGGLDRTRICDLLRVKPVVGFFWLSDFYPVLITLNSLGNLLFARSVTPVVVGDGVLIRFRTVPVSREFSVTGSCG